ncbi:2-isopropylmalate synthase [Roseiconus lacunae]|uniref:2-isopropylmalate synthase n=1 Tax=Roseiconus lacunae TaxID=2605694 RepID=A0ABT7PIQ9_9BACT|nr:2-isopropylmalate synthase [Roseiconus lacunae]MCD0458491.1 2-isopropylmalate synthase [Roseiconus lacunae]MDM4016379.1 2-isopropylmalate synthase [Roseiconus lacunae]WRQ52019.1 2-isopropylmalate synthase [Stieleria sp. HD01]
MSSSSSPATDQPAGGDAAGAAETATEKRHIRIFDTTLRDGEQSPGASMNLSEKLEVAHHLADLGVDIIEAGFPIASPGDFESVRQIAESIDKSTICGLARCSEKDILRAADAIAPAQQGRIHVFLATSAIHREFKLRMTPDEIVRRAVEGVKLARSRCEDIEFSPEDACRTEHDFLCRVVEAAIDAGATTINVPDTVGYITPEEVFKIFQMLRNRVPNIDKAVLSTHCHDDLGMAVANSLAAVAAGAGQIECTINGIGERAGNAALEEVVMAMKTRSDFYQTTTRIDSKRLVPVSRLVSKVTGINVQRNKAIVGRNAFAHESGIHQDGMLKERSTYEIMSPEEVGFVKTDLVLGKHSGRAALADRAKTLGFHLEGEELQRVFEQFKVLADKKKEIYDGDIMALVQQEISGKSEGQAWSLVNYEVTSKTGQTPRVKLTLSDGNEEKSAEVAEGDGPIDAAFWAVEQITGIDLICKEFRVRSATLGRDAIGEVNLEVEHKGKLYRGVGVSTDSVESTILAMLNAINRIAGGAA